jgi:hypothetical protein
MTDAEIQAQAEKEILEEFSKVVDVTRPSENPIPADEAIAGYTMLISERAKVIRLTEEIEKLRADIHPRTKCPLCDGTGLTNKPPGIAGDQPTWAGTDTGPYPCRICNGRGLIF